MSSEARIAANTLNAQMSTGPRTAEGKARSSQNARKHPMRDEREKLMREDSLAYEERLRRWSGNTKPETDVEEYLLHQNAVLAASFDRVERAHVEHLRTRIEKADEIARQDAHALGNRLFFDPCGPTELYGSRPSDWPKHRTSWDPEAKVPEDPQALVWKLESTKAGCHFMLDRFHELRSFLEQPKGFWRGSDRLKCIRLLGRNPVQAGDERRIAEIFAASHALRPIGGAFDDLLTDMGFQAHEKFVNEIKARWTDLVGAGKPDTARQILIDLVDQNIERIEALLEEHDQNPEDKNRRSMDRLGVDKSRDGEFFLRNEQRFSNAVNRGLHALQKYQENRKKDGRQRERDDVSRFQPAVPLRAPRGADGILGRAVDREPEPDLSWLAESGMLTPTRVWASDAVVESLENATAPGAPSPALESFEETARREANFTNEANIDENVFLPQVQENDAVVADSEVVPGLDKLQTKPTHDGESDVPEISNPSAETSNPKPQIPNPKSPEPDEESAGRPAPLLSPRLPKRERRRQRKEIVRRAEERRLMAKLDELPSEAARLDYLIQEMRANSAAEVDALLPLGMPAGAVRSGRDAGPRSRLESIACNGPSPRPSPSGRGSDFPSPSATDPHPDPLPAGEGAGFSLPRQRALTPVRYRWERERDSRSLGNTPSSRCAPDRRGREIPAPMETDPHPGPLPMREGARFPRSRETGGG